MRTVLLTTSCLAALSADDMTSYNQSTTPPSNCQLEIPTCRYAMGEVFAELVVLQPNGSNIYYAAEAFPFNPNLSVPAVDPNWEIYEFQPNYTPGFNIGAKTHFTDLNTTLAANWERLYSTKHASHVAVKSVQYPNMVGPLFSIGPNDAQYKEAIGSIHFHFDEVNLLYGQRFCAFKRLSPMVYAAASFNRIKQIQSTLYSDYVGSTTRTIRSYSTFTGAGPKLGLDFDYRIVYGLFFTGSTSLGMIIGESQNGTTYDSTADALANMRIAVNDQSTTVPNRTQLVPSIEERLGLSYAGIWKCFKFTFGIGYQAQIYLNAVQSIDITAPQAIPNDAIGVSTVTGLYAVGFERTLSNFMLTGPYASFNMSF